jgi:hypothetical protein
LKDISEGFFVLSWSAGSNDNPVGFLMFDIVRQKIPAFFRTEEVMYFDICNIIKTGRIPGEFTEI